MAKQRKVGNLLALAVLSTVIERPMHPYEIASLLRSRGKEDDMDIKWGSLYTVVRNMVKHGFIEVVDTERAGARPERTVYRITDAGRAELVDWARELVSTPQPEHPKLHQGCARSHPRPSRHAAGGFVTLPMVCECALPRILTRTHELCKRRR